MADSDAGDAAASSEINGVIAPADIHILIVEDDPVTRRIVKKFVTKCDYQATAVGDGNTALDLMRSDPEAYSLVLSDVRMPSMSGLELLRHIRQDAVLRNVPIIMMSNTDQTEMAYQCLQEGADDYMLKPIRLDYIKGIWRNVWRKRRENAKSLLLEEEKRKRLEMEEAIGSLQERVSEAIETPLTIIIKTIADMMKGANLTEEVKDTMGVVLQQLQSSSLYEPAFANLMNDTSVDDETKSWLQTQVNMGTTSVRDLESLQIHELRTSPATVAGDTEFNTDPEEVAETIAALREIQFDCWNIDEERMTFNIVCMMQDLGLIDRFSIDMPTLLNFINELRRCYDDNPYHNFRHAFDVTQMAYWLLVSGGALEWLSSLDVLVLVLASLCHDVRHPGTNNVFQVNTESRLALLYNDQSVLEMYHTCTAFEILRRPDCNIIAALTRDEYKEFRSLCIKSILATDLQRHVEIVSKFDAIVANFNKNALEDRALLLQVVIKAADISNPLRPFMIARLWSDMIIEEGFRQGEKEAQLGLPISPFMDRHTCNQAKMSVGFLDFLVIPLYSSIARLLPRCEICVDLLKNNRYRWSALLNETGAGGGGATGGAASHSHDHDHDHDGHDHGGGGDHHHHHGEAATSKPSKSE